MRLSPKLRLPLLLGILALVAAYATFVFFRPASVGTIHPGTDVATATTPEVIVATSTPTVVVVTTTPVKSTPHTPAPAPKPKPTPPVVVTPAPAPVATTTVVTVGTTTLTVALVPLLSGGTVHAGQTVPISYLQIKNTGKYSTYVKGFWIKQNGSAPVEAIIGLTTVDDRGGSRGTSGGIEGSTPFTKQNTAFVPTNALFTPGQLRLFTIKAVLTGNTLPYYGTQLIIEVTSVDTDATVMGQFPIQGTTWTIQ